MSYIGSDPIPPNKGGTGVLNLKTSKITVGGALTFTGAFTSNFNLLGITNVTVPLSGTLATTTVGGSGTGVSSFNTNGVVISGTSSTFPLAAVTLTNGQIVIGSTAGAPIASTITAGTGITVTNGANSITIAVTGSGVTWTDVTSATQTLAVANGYVTDHTNVTYTLPATAALGDEIIIVGKLGITTIAQNANQQILMGSASSTVGVGGSVAGTNVGDCITMNCITAGASTVWRSTSFVGNWTVT